MDICGLKRNKRDINVVIRAYHIHLRKETSSVNPIVEASSKILTRLALKQDFKIRSLFLDFSLISGNLASKLKR